MSDRPDSPTIARAIRDGAARLAGVAENPRLEARLLLARALGLTQNDLIRDPNHQIDTTAYENLLLRRTMHEPLALIVGHREFWSMAFKVSPATLIPRPDSETLIEAAVVAFTARPHPGRIIDLGTGTGCLLLALLAEFPGAFGIGLDLAPDAAALAKANAIQLGFASRSAFLAGNWADAISGRFDLVISNPPYIPGPVIETLMPEVARHEPARALDGGIDGYDAYRTILPRLKDLLEPDGIAILELGRGQAKYVTYLAREAGFDASLRVDLAEISRAIVLGRPNL
jgi:release factor glutamine methyltransferase